MVIKRNGELVEFDKTKIYNAIMKAMKYGSGDVNEHVAMNIASKAEQELSNKEVTISEIELFIYDELIKRKHKYTAKAYFEYKAVQDFKRQSNTTDESILGLVDFTNNDVMTENSNKDAKLASTQRDLIAGEVSKDISRRKLLPAHIVQAHDNGVLHFHDMDYYLQSIHNCDLVNIADMLDNGTVINKRMIETPKSFRVACTVMTQIIAQVSSSQYGGQSINIKHLGKYLRKSKDKFNKLTSMISNKEEREKIFNELYHDELSSGVQTIQYQINTLMTTNGQSPFITLFLDIDENSEYIEEIADIVEEIIKQRIQGIKNEKGIYTTPSFPKLVYVLYEHNSLNGGKYDYITKLCCKCNIKRLYPDYISSKEMKKIYDGNVFSPMGCRSFLSPYKDENGEYKFEGRFNMGVVSINLPQIAIIADGNERLFWDLLDNRLELCFEALMCRYEHLKGTKSDVAPILWRYGALARLESGETIDKLLENGYATISLGYIGVYEMTKLMTGVSHTEPKGTEFALKVIKRLREACDEWKKRTGLGFGLYGTPSEGLCNRFAKIDKARFGEIKDVTDKGYYTNSYHVDVREEIGAFDKLLFESQFQPISSGGCISYVEIPNMNNNVQAIETMVRFIYDNIQYAEFNTKSDYCMECGYDGEIKLDENDEWYCPNCGNRDKAKMNVVRRTCGYLGENYWNEGKTKEIKSRVLHLE